MQSVRGHDIGYDTVVRAMANPWLVAIRAKGKHLCSGSIINKYTNILNIIYLKTMEIQFYVSYSLHFMIFFITASTFSLPKTAFMGKTCSV